MHESTRINPLDVRDVDGIAVMRPERVLLELAGIVRSPDFIEAIFHTMLRKRLVTVESTTATFNCLARRGVRGVQRLRSVLQRWDPELAPTESVPETALYQILRDAGLGTRVVPQFVVRDRHGAFVGRVDVGLPDVGILSEYDSDQEHTDPISIARDNARRNRLMALGWIVVTARRSDVRQGGDAVITAVRAHLRRQPA